VDLARAKTDLNNLIDKRARGRVEANAAEMAWKESVRRHNAKLWRERRAEWFCYWSALADSLRKSADDFERRATELLEDSEGAER
jgi:hypothetical protein